MTECLFLFLVWKTRHSQVPTGYAILVGTVTCLGHNTWEMESYKYGFPMFVWQLLSKRCSSLPSNRHFYLSHIWTPHQKSSPSSTHLPFNLNAKVELYFCLTWKPFFTSWYYFAPRWWYDSYVIITLHRPIQARYASIEINV
jgi:hypothetical protein